MPILSKNNHLNINRSAKERKTQFFFEALLILLAVIIGLIVNEIRENHNDNKKTDRLIKSIYSDIKKNYEIVENTISIHKKYAQRLKKYIAENRGKITNLSGYQIINNSINAKLELKPISFFSWEIAKNSKYIDNVGFDFKLKLSGLSESIIIINKMSETIVDTMYHLKTFKIEDTIPILEKIHALFINLINSEINLVKKYKILLNNIK